MFAPEAEAVVNGLQAVGIRSRLRPMERAAFYKADQDKQFKHLIRVGSGAAGNAATRIEAFVMPGGIRSYGGYPDIDALFREQAARDRPQAPRGAAPPDPAAHARARDVRADRGAAPS